MAAFNPNIAPARRLFEKVGGFTEFSVDTFDMFIIDEGLATDPETSDTKSPAYKGFVQQRGAQKNAISRAAAQLPNGEAYRIEIVEAGARWRIVPLADAVGDDYRTYAQDSVTKVENAQKRLKNMETQMRKKLGNDYDPRLMEVMNVNSMMVNESIGFVSGVKGLAARYDEAYRRANKIILDLAKDAGVELLDDQSAND